MKYNPNKIIEDKLFFSIPIYQRLFEWDTDNIVTLLDDLKKENEQSDTSSLENEINRLVFELYGLTNEEVKFVNPNEQVSGEDCDLFKA